MCDILYIRKTRQVDEMRKLLTILWVLAVLLSLPGCNRKNDSVRIVTTTAPLYTFTSKLCIGTDISVDCLITENVSCLHDYTLQTRQMRALEDSELIIASGFGLEESFTDILSPCEHVLYACEGITPLCADDGHAHEDHGHGHHHDEDPHTWLSPENAKLIVRNISNALKNKYPQYKEIFDKNCMQLQAQLDDLSTYAKSILSNLAEDQLITFHDGFGYLADAFGLHILRAVEEESGREASASELIELCNLVKSHQLSCIFVEKNGSVSAAEIIAAETGAAIYELDMAMSGDYFDAMYHNIDTLKEALG
jgi:ABC-type Zn uptake system ZnuABC Zn-binding protein ZnuA